MSFDDDLQKNLFNSNVALKDVSEKVNRLYLSHAKIKGPITIKSRKNAKNRHCRSGSRHSSHKTHLSSDGRITRSSSSSSRSTFTTHGTLGSGSSRSGSHHSRPDSPAALSVEGGLSVGKDICVDGGLKINSRRAPKKGKRACRSRSKRKAALQVCGGATFGERVLLCEDEDVECSSPLEKGSLRVTGGIGLGGHLATIGGICSHGDVVISSTSSASCAGTSPASGALQVAGSVGIGGNLIVCNTESAVCTGTVPTSGAIQVAGGASFGGNVSICSTTASVCNGTSPATAALFVAGGIASGGELLICGTTPASCNGGAPVGSLVVGGGAAIGGNLVVCDTTPGSCLSNGLAPAGGAIVATGGAAFGGQVHICDSSSVSCVTVGTSTSLTSALSVTGGGAFGGDLIVGGSITMNAFCGCNNNPNTLLNAVGTPGFVGLCNNSMFQAGQGTLGSGTNPSGTFAVTFATPYTTTPFMVGTDVTSTVGSGVSINPISTLGATLHGANGDVVDWMAFGPLNCCQ